MFEIFKRVFATPSADSAGGGRRDYYNVMIEVERKGTVAEKFRTPRLVNVEGDKFTYRLEATFDPLKENSVREALDRYKAELGQTAYITKEEIKIENGLAFAEITVSPKQK